MQVIAPKSLGDTVQSLLFHGDSRNETLVEDNLAAAERLDGHLWMTLPAELIVEIFQHTMTGPMALSPFQLGKICQSWRHIVFNSCQLWSCVELEFDQSRYDSQLLLLEEYLERAMDVPLSLDISCIQRPMQDTKAKYDHLIDIIAAKSSQVISMNLRAPGGVYTRLSRSPISFGALNQLFISTDEDESNDILGSPVRTFEKSSQLTEVTIHHFYITSFSLPWAQFLHLKLHLVTPHEICEAVLWSPNLQTLDVDFATDGPDAVGDIILPPEITHHNLQRFTFSGSDDLWSTSTTEAFNRLHLLNLKAFTFCLGNPLRTFFLRPFVSASRFPLEELLIQSVCIPESDLIGCLQLLPSLRRLQLSDNEWSDVGFVGLGAELFRLMKTVPGERSSLLPSLQSLTFQGVRLWLFGSRATTKYVQCIGLVARRRMDSSLYQ